MHFVIRRDQRGEDWVITCPTQLVRARQDAAEATAKYPGQDIWIFSVDTQTGDCGSERAIEPRERLTMPFPGATARR